MEKGVEKISYFLTQGLKAFFQNCSASWTKFPGFILAPTFFNILWAIILELNRSDDQIVVLDAVNL